MAAAIRVQSTTRIPAEADSGDPHCRPGQRHAGDRCLQPWTSCNTGHFQYVPNPDFNGTDTFTYRAADAATGLVSNTIATVTLTVRAKNDVPTIDIAALQTTPPGLTLDEDDLAGLTFSNLILGDLVDDSYDPADTELRLELSVQHGGITIDRTNLLTIAEVPADVDAVAPLVDADPLVTTYQSVTLRGTILDLNTALTTLVYYGDENFNTGLNGEGLVVHINDLGYSDQATAAYVFTDPQAMTARATLPITVRPINDDPVADTSGILDTEVDEDDPAGLSLATIVVSDGDDAADPADIRLEVTLSVLNGGLTVDPTYMVANIGAGANDPRVPGVAFATYQQVTLQGTIAELNGLSGLRTLMYYNDLNFNTHELPPNGRFQNEELRIHLDDLGNTDYQAGQNRYDDETVALKVMPINDRPTATVPNPFVFRPTVTEDSTTGVLLAGGPNQILVADIDDVSDPRNIQLEVTLSVPHGGLLLGSTTRLTVVSSTPALNPPTDLVEPVKAGTFQVLVIRGMVGDLNAALRTLRYYPDKDFTGTEVLTVAVNDLGNTDKNGTPLDAVPPGQLTITVTGVNDLPTIGLPPSQAVNEDAQLVFSAANLPPNAVTVGDVDVLETVGGVLRVTVSVSSGKLTLPEVAGVPDGMELSFPLDIDGNGVSDDADLSGTIEADEVAGLAFRQITMSGTPADVNAALDGMIYQGNQDFNGTDKLVVTVNDLGNTGAGLLPSPDVTGTVTITVAPSMMGRH